MLDAVRVDGVLAPDVTIPGYAGGDAKVSRWEFRSATAGGLEGGVKLRLMFEVETERGACPLAKDRSRRARRWSRGPLLALEFRGSVDGNEPLLLLATVFNLEEEVARDNSIEVLIPEGREYWDSEDITDTGAVNVFREASGVDGGVVKGFCVACSWLSIGWLMFFTGLVSDSRDDSLLTVIGGGRLSRPLSPNS